MRSYACRIGMLSVLFLLIASPALADMGFYGWGPRVGLSDDPDQGIIGAHFDFGEFAPNVRFRPSLELGFGDDVDSFLINALVAYHFQTQSDVEPYAGGQIVGAFFDPDHGDSDTEIGFDAVGGVEMLMSAGNRFLVELQFGFGDIHDLKLMVGWTFGAR